MLSPYRVIDLPDARAELGALILAGLGADVIKVEPRGAARRGASWHPTGSDLCNRLVVHGRLVLAIRNACIA